MDDTHNDHDHSQDSHNAKCDLCEYVAKTHAHDDESAVADLANNLAAHNKEVHSTETDPENIKEAVKAKMQAV